MSSKATPVVGEMSAHLSDCDTECEQKRIWCQKFNFRVARAIWSDVAAWFRRAGGKAADKGYQALVLMKKAQHPSSPGGTSITPEEAKPITSLVEGSYKINCGIREVARV